MSIQSGFIIIGLISILPSIYCQRHLTKLWLLIYILISPFIYSTLFYYMMLSFGIILNETSLASYILTFAMGSFIGDVIGIFIEILINSFQSDENED